MSYILQNSLYFNPSLYHHTQSSRGGIFSELQLGIMSKVFKESASSFCMGFSAEISEKCKLFCDWERPPLFRTLAARGQGFLRVRQGKYAYLVRYSAEGVPELMGRMVEKFRKMGDKYAAAYLPVKYFSAREKTKLEALLT